MNLKLADRLTGKLTQIVSIPNRDFMNLKPDWRERLIFSTAAVSIPNRDFMNLKLPEIFTGHQLIIEGFNP